MRRYAALYGFLFTSHLRSMLEYKTSFWLSFASIIATTAAGLATIGVVFTHVDAIAGWTFRELFFLYALSIIGMSFHHAFTNSVIYVEQYIREGTLDQLLCLPVNTLFYMVARRYTPLGLGNLIIGIFYLVVAGQLVDMQWDVFKVVLVIAFVIAGNLIWFSIMLFFGTMSFWVTRTNAPVQSGDWPVRINAVSAQYIRAVSQGVSILYRPLCFCRLLSGSVLVGQGRSWG